MIKFTFSLYETIDLDIDFFLRAKSLSLILGHIGDIMEKEHKKWQSSALLRI